MKLYISPTSPYSRICLARALQLGLDDLPMQLVDPWQNPPELEAVNPLSQIPVLLLNDGSVIAGTLSIWRTSCPRRATCPAPRRPWPCWTCWRRW